LGFRTFGVDGGGRGVACLDPASEYPGLIIGLDIEIVAQYPATARIGGHGRAAISRRRERSHQLPMGNLPPRVEL